MSAVIKSVLLSGGGAFNTLPYYADTPEDVYVLNSVIISTGNSTFDIELKSGQRIFFDGTTFGLKNSGGTNINTSNVTSVRGTRFFYLTSYNDTIYLTTGGFFSGIQSNIYLYGMFDHGSAEGTYSTWETFLNAWNNSTYRNYIKCGFNVVGSNGVELRYRDDSSSSAPYFVTAAFQYNIQRLSLTAIDSENVIDYRPSTDPYYPGGTSEPGGGSGSFDLSSDAVDFPGLPTLSAVDTGLVTIYTPTLAQMRSLANYMWNADVQTVDWWKKLVANPLDLILGLSIVPVTVPAGTSQNIKVGFIDTGISMTKAASQFVEVDCGSLNVTEFFGSALDYSPFRKTSIYLPFIGTRTLSTDDIMGKTVQVKYHIDILSGALTAMIKAGDAVLYQYSGSCSISLPLTGQTFTDMITSTIQLAAGIAGTVAGGSAMAGASLASAANNVMGMKPHIERAGGVSGPAGQLGIMRPYLIGEIPRQSVPANYNEFAGYPSNIKAVLGDLTGFTQVETVYLSDIAATDAELEEIETLLKEGVFINAA